MACLKATAGNQQDHVPAAPILPEVALMAVAVEPLLITAKAAGCSLYVRGFPTMCMKMLCFHDDELLISGEDTPPQQETELAIKVTCRGKTVCQGRGLAAVT
jgi:hypothetical protein